MITKEKLTSVVMESILREDFVSFYERCHIELNPSTPFSRAWFIEYLAYELQKMLNGDTNRLLVAVPPRAGKTMMISVAFTAWCMGHDPSLRIIGISYSQDLANKIAASFRIIVESDWFQKLFPKFQIDPSKNTEREVMTTMGGSRFATSVGGGLTGFGGDILVLDDIIKADDARKETIRNLVMGWLQKTAFSRLDDQKNGKIILIGQRLHPLDPIGQLMEKNTWRYISLPLVAEKTETYRLARVNGYKEKTWKVGEFLDPTRWNEDVIRDLRENMGAHAFNAQYLQQPEHQEDFYIEWKWFPQFEKPPLFDLLILTVDPAQATKSTNDWSAIVVIGVLGELSYILHIDRVRLGFIELQERILQLARQFRADVIVVEAKGDRDWLVESLKKNGKFRIECWIPKESKLARAMSVLPEIETGKVGLLKEANWLDAFRNEIQAFPNSQFDDQIDALSQFLIFRKKICSIADEIGNHRDGRCAMFSYSIYNVRVTVF